MVTSDLHKERLGIFAGVCMQTESLYRWSRG
jgi:hypothetical protein